MLIDTLSWNLTFDVNNKAQNKNPPQFDIFFGLTSTENIPPWFTQWGKNKPFNPLIIGKGRQNHVYDFPLIV